jgi:predicted PurR-regulated permease PerM
MKLDINDKYRKIGFTAFLVIIASMITVLLFTQLPKVGQFLALAIGILKPVIYGALIAYLVDPIVKYFEDSFLKKLGARLFPKDEGKAWVFVRFMGVTLSMIVVLSFLAVLIVLVVPRLVDSIRSLISNFNVYAATIQNWISSVTPADSEIGTQAQTLSSQIFESLSDFLQKLTNGDMIESLMSKVFSSIYSFLRETLNLIIGLIVAVYVLVAKEKFIAEIKKLLYGLFPSKRVNGLLDLAHESNQIFGGFIAGKVIDSIIIGILTYIIMVLFRMPYKELVGVVVGITNIIPFFGPFIGAIPCFIIIFLSDPIKGLVFLPLILAIQQIDGNIIGPRILGQTVGLGSFWVIVAILLGGGLFGFPGLLFGVPVFALFYTLLKEYVEDRLKRRGLPTDTEVFKTISYIDSATMQPVYKDIPDKMGIGTQDEERGSDTETSGE